MTRVHMLSGNDEYRAEQSLRKLAIDLRRREIATSTISCGRDRGEDLPDLERLAHADIMLVFCKRMTLPPAQLSLVQEWCARGRPVIGIRTASHAFQNWLDFDKSVLGGDYSGHGPDTPTTLAFDRPHHPVLCNLMPWRRADKIYLNHRLAADAEVLVHAEDCSDDPAAAGQPLAWTRGQNVFYTSMGHPHDFDDERYLTMLAGAVQFVSRTSRPSHATDGCFSQG